MPYKNVHFAKFSSHLCMFWPISVATVVHTQEVANDQIPVMLFELWFKILDHALVDSVEIPDVE